MRSNYNKVEYCLGNAFDLFSASTVLVACQDSSVIAFVNNTRINEVNGMIILPRMVGNI